MSTATLNKVDMSLDDIIKINKAEKREKAKFQAARGAKTNQGRGQSNRGTGRGRGRGGTATRGAGRGRGRGGAVAVSALRGSQRGGVLRGRGGRGRGNLTSTTRGRGAGQRNSTVLSGRGRGNNNSGIHIQPQVFKRSGAKAQANRGDLQLFTKSGLSKQAAAQQQNQRLNKARKQAALLREKQLALKNLQQAQKNMQTVNLAIQKTNRNAVVNQMRGISTAGLPTAATTGRGRRKLLSNLGQLGNNPANLNNNNNNSFKPNRQLNYTSVTISNPAALRSAQNPRGRRRPWNKPKAAAPASSEPFKIEVTNQSPVPLPKPQQSSVLEKLKSLKPAVPTTYKFQKNVFAAPTTGLSLSERFSSTSSSSSSPTGNHLEDRKVFV